MKDLFCISPFTLFKIKPPLSNKLIINNVTLSVFRLDLIDNVAGGNKLFKLKYNLEEARLKGYDTLLTFGGAYSNHIAATALAGKTAGFKTIGIIRGEKTFPLNKTLARALDDGMQLEFVSREQYRKKDTDDFIKELKNKFGAFYLLPEGGSNDLAVKGCAEILSLINDDFDYVVCPTATGATLAGLALSLKPHQKAVGICVLNNEPQIRVFVKRHFTNNVEFPEIITEYVMGGYAKSNPSLEAFIKSFMKDYKISVEPIYTGKMFYGLFDLMDKKHFKNGSHVVAVHTGGLQYL